MRTELWNIAVVLMIAVSIAAADLPPSFYSAMDNMKSESILCIKNYQAGASITERYYDFDHLEKETKVSSWTNKPDSIHRINPRLEASINSNVAGRAHIGWVSADPGNRSKMPHMNYVRNIDDLIGVFSVEMFIQLWGNSTTGDLSLDWMPCI